MHNNIKQNVLCSIFSSYICYVPLYTYTGAGMDPHFAVPLSSGHNLCYSLQGIANFVFNLISDPLININAHFISPKIENNLKDYSTFLGDVGIMIKSPKCLKNDKCANKDIIKMKISAEDNTVLLDNSKIAVTDKVVYVVVENDTTTVKLERNFKKEEQRYVIIEVRESQLAFKFQFFNSHLDLIILDLAGISDAAHGVMGKWNYCYCLSKCITLHVYRSVFA